MKLTFLTIAIFLALHQCCMSVSASVPGSVPTVTSIPDTGWRLWLDDKAPWQNDKLYLPDEIDLSSMPVNPPTGGWGVLGTTSGIPVSLPGTVEEHYWGQAPANVLDPSNLNNLVAGNGCYHGVSWWYRTFIPPTLAPGERLILSFPGARLRAEVYVNGQLVGYDCVTETEFDADATKAIKPGEPNLLAVRITNAGGSLSWGDYGPFYWGQYEMPMSHDFGGLNCGITMGVRGPVAVTDLAMLNTPDPRTVTFTAQLTSSGPAYNGPLDLDIFRDGQAVWRGTTYVNVKPNGASIATDTVNVPSAQLWDIGKPNLYLATASIPSIEHSDKSTAFGFRWFTAKGVGTDAMLYLNGRRIVVKSAISWGFWSPNGIFPDHAAADREVAAVKSFGLNCIQNHRHMPKPIVLDAFDHAGLMRYCEAGAGAFTFDNPKGTVFSNGPIDTSGQGGAPSAFYNSYELYKVLSMIRTERSHPSAIIWSLQNEAGVNLHNPKIFYTLHKMREADPSRIILLESGFSTHDEVWALPYSDNLLYDQGQGSGWNDRHTASQSRGVYQDSDYNSATDFVYNTPVKTEVSVWGEMATGASADDHAVMAQWYKTNHLTGYDVEAHNAVNAGYEKFITGYGFRDAFPTAESLFRETADMHYYSAARMMENARMCDLNDYIVLSGWESTVVDNHSGLVDALRLPTSDPAPIQAAASPDLLVVRAVHYVISKGAPATVDVHLINENVLHGAFTLEVKAFDGNSEPIYETSVPVNVDGGVTFAQILKDNITFTPRQQGYTTIVASLTGPGSSAPILTKSDRILVINTDPSPLHTTVATIGSPAIADSINRQFGLSASPFSSSDSKLDTIVIGAVLSKTPAGVSDTWKQSTTDEVHSTQNPGLYKEQYFGPAGTLAAYEGLANGPANVTLYFVETFFDRPGQRLFDIALNGQTVARNFDIFKEAGGENIGVNRTFPVDITNGKLSVSVPVVEANNANCTAIQVVDSSGHFRRTVLGAAAYTDSQGNHWLGTTSVGYDWADLPPDVLTRVHDDGTRLVLLSSDSQAYDVQDAADALASRHILTYSGLVGDSNASWMGRWYFAKKNWLLDGLPSNCVLDWQYQISGGNGMLISAPGLEGVIGYGINHSPQPSLGAAIVPYGKGEIVLFCIPGLAQTFVNGAAEGLDPVTATRIVYNCLAGPGGAPG